MAPRRCDLNLPGRAAPAMLGCASILHAQTRLAPVVHELMEALQEEGEDPTLDEGPSEEAA